MRRLSTSLGCSSRAIAARVLCALMLGGAVLGPPAPAEALPKKPANYTCICGCEYKDSQGVWQWGDDVTFSSSNCHQWKNKKQSCFTNGGLRDGRLTMCMVKDPKGATTGVQGGTSGVLDSGGRIRKPGVGAPATGGVAP